MDNRKIDICIPHFNRPNMVFESFNNVYKDIRIKTINIWDDGSSVENYNKLVQNINKHDYLNKIVLKRSDVNQGVHIAKKKAVEMGTTPFVILFDSDNILKIDYIDTLFSIPEWKETRAYQPSFLAPHFDFRDKAGLVIFKENLKEVLSTPNNKLDTFGNAQNFFIHRENYLKVWEEGVNVNGNDSLWFTYLWLKAGNSMYLVPNLQYFHRVDSHSTEQTGNYNSDKSAGHKIEQTMKKLKQLANAGME